MSTRLSAYGVTVSPPAGFEGRVFRRPAHGEVSAAAADGPPAPAVEVPNVVMHLATIALPPDTGDFASGAVDRLAADDVLIVLFEYESASAGQPLFAHKGIPRTLAVGDFSPGVLQRTIAGQAGCQFFFTESGRPFCLYVVLGSFARRAERVATVNAVLATLTVEPLDAEPVTGDDHAASGTHEHDAIGAVKRPAARPDHHPAAHDDDPRADADDAMSALAGPFVIAAALLAVGGALKAIDPNDTAHALGAIGLPHASLLVRAGGIAEVVVGIGALAVGGPVFAALVALSYLAFAGFVVIAVRSESPISSCGCFGKVDTPPSPVHVLIDLVAAGVALAVALAGDAVALPDVLADQPMLGVPFVILAVTGTYLVFLAFTALPKTLAATHVAREARG